MKIIIFYLKNNSKIRNIFAAKVVYSNNNES